MLNSYLFVCFLRVVCFLFRTWYLSWIPHYLCRPVFVFLIPGSCTGINVPLLAVSSRFDFWPWSRLQFRAFKYFRSHQFSNPYFFALSQREPVTHKIFVLVSILMLACICKVLPVSLAEYLITSMHLRFYWIFWMVEVDHKPHFCEKCKDPIHSL